MNGAETVKETGRLRYPCSSRGLYSPAFGGLEKRRERRSCGGLRTGVMSPVDTVRPRRADSADDYTCAQWRVASAECGMRTADCGARSAECGMRNGECGMGSSGLQTKTIDRGRCDIYHERGLRCGKSGRQHLRVLHTRRAFGRQLLRRRDDRNCGGKAGRSPVYYLQAARPTCVLCRNQIRRRIGNRSGGTDLLD